jgi:hypothetical protein
MIGSEMSTDSGGRVKSIAETTAVLTARDTTDVVTLADPAVVEAYLGTPADAAG